MSDNPREYLKLKYMGECKCGRCQLVPPEMLELWARQLEIARAALRRLSTLPPADREGK